MADRLELYCVNNGKSIAEAFYIEISAEKPVHALKKLIKNEKPAEFKDVDADQLILWAVSIPIDSDKVISVDICQPKTKLLPATDLSEVFPDIVPKKTICILIQSPSLDEEKFSAVVVAVTLRNTRKTFGWCVDLKTATLASLREHILRVHPGFTKKRDSIRILHDSALIPGESTLGYIADDQDLQHILQVKHRAGIKDLVLDVLGETIPFNSFKYEQIKTIWGIEDFNNLQNFDDLAVACLESEMYLSQVEILYSEVERWRSVIGPPRNEPETSKFVACFLGLAIQLFPALKLSFEKNFIGRRGNGKADYAIVSRIDEDHTLCVIEVKHKGEGDADMKQGCVQNIVQMESAITDPDPFIKLSRPDSATLTCYGIVTNSICWRFSECVIDTERDPNHMCPKFRSSTASTTILYDGSQWKEQAKEIFGNIVWLLELIMKQPIATSPPPNLQKRVKSVDLSSALATPPSSQTL
ncbi:hypothetical protein BGX28_009108 [Mortierella sp. GBA30]|nr:hypothetical protein BGX28_009108 [Mortierella sp. GBA30]